jgi:hypothetical protein
MLALQVAAYAIALWLGCYLLARQPLTRSLVFTGLGLLVYAGALAADALAGAAPTVEQVPGWLRLIEWPLRLGPAACWLLAMVELVPALRRPDLPIQRARPLVLLTTLFLGLGTGLLLAPVGWLPPSWVLLGIGVDLLALGWVVVALDALDAGERLRSDFARSLATALLVLVLLGGQVVLALALTASFSVVSIALLLGVTAGAIALPAFWDHLQELMDRAVFGGGSPIGESRSALRAAASALPRQRPSDDLLALSEDEFAALTRRALSSLGDVPKLAASALTRLPAIDERLARRGARGDLLERAAELRALLAESVARLKPQDGADFGTTDAWRHYNALYFPYVVGLRPYQRRLVSDRSKGAPTPDDEVRRAAMRWLRAEVPVRTLFNWQRAAARLVAMDLRQRAVDSPPATGTQTSTPAKLAAGAAQDRELASAGRSFRSTGSG